MDSKMNIESEKPLTQLNVRDLEAKVIWDMILDLAILLVTKSNSNFHLSTDLKTIHITTNHNFNPQQ